MRGRSPIKLLYMIHPFYMTMEEQARTYKNRNKGRSCRMPLCKQPLSPLRGFATARPSTPKRQGQECKANKKV